MARPEKLRKVGCGARGQGFKPIGRPFDDFDVEPLRMDELEALRLADLEGLYQETAAVRMAAAATRTETTLKEITLPGQRRGQGQGQRMQTGSSAGRGKGDVLMCSSCLKNSGLEDGPNQS